MAKTLKDLALALLNATLILIALCLFLAWQVASTARDVTGRLSEELADLAPLRGTVQDTKDELTGLRQDLAGLRDGDGPAVSQQVQARLAVLEERLDMTAERLNALSGAPERLIDHAVETAADAAAQRVMAIRGCVPAT
jgi:hypothetical protein